MASPTEKIHAIVINAPDRASTPIPTRKSVFLAGSIVKDDHWRKTIIKALSHLPIIILNPYQPKWDFTWKQDISDERFKEQVTWELDMMEGADIIAAYFAPETDAPITMLEVGLAAGDTKLIIACPESKFSRRGNFQILAERRNGIDLVDSLEELSAGIERRLSSCSKEEAG